MPHADFVHLRVHSVYSLSEGALRCKEIGALCRRFGLPAVAITDTNNLFGALEFCDSVAAQGVQPIVGCQINLTRMHAEAQAGRSGRLPAPEPVVLLAQSAEGYRNLCWLSSHAFLETPPALSPQVSASDLAAHNAGLICLTGGLSGPVGMRLSEGQDAQAVEALEALKRIFEDRLYVELQRHGLEAEARIEARTVALADRLELPLVATNDCYFNDADMFEAHDALLCINESSYVAQKDRRRVTPEHRFKSAEEMRLTFADLPEAIENTLVIARRSAFKVSGAKAILPKIAGGDAKSEEASLRLAAEAGLKLRLAHLKITGAAALPYRQRLDFELDVITRVGFAGYFLIVADFIQWAKQQKIPVGPGRGSGAGSVVAWALTITDLDPLRFGLLFERFLNPERVSMPDFDIDFCQERRDEVIRYVGEKYGLDRVAHIITFGKLQARAALRDVGRVLQLPLGQVDRLCKMVPNNPAQPVTLKEAIGLEPRLAQERDADEAVARMLEIALKLEGLYRNASTHAAGVVIADRPLTEIVPLYRDPRAGLPATQFSMKYAEEIGLVKFDFLGLKTLTVLDRAVKLLARRGVEIDLLGLALDDPKTFALMGRGDTVGVFQMESSGVRDALRQLKPDCFEDLIAMVALYRPGPMENIPRYIRCKHGAEAPDYLDPSLKPVLEETYGVVIYQEQVMEIARVLAGYSLGEADVLRRAMGKKIRSEMNAQRERFTTGAVTNGVPAHRATHIFELVEKFAGYGFNKSHAAAYALIAYQTGYLKANYPVEFLAATMSLEMANSDKLNFFHQEVRRLGIALLAPDINRSGVEFTVEAAAAPTDGSGAPGEPGANGANGGLAIRYALAAVKNVGEGAMRQIVAERERGGPFADLADFAARLPVEARNKRLIENLVKAGVFDRLEPNRAKVFAGAEAILRHAQLSAETRHSAQSALFGGGDALKLALLDAPAWTMMDRLTREFEAIGFYLLAHPLDAYAKALSRHGVVRYADLARSLGQATSKHRIAGTVIGKQERTSARGNRFAFVQCSDPSGMFEVTVFQELLSAHRERLEAGQSLVFQVEAKLDGDQPRMTVQSIESLEAIAARHAAGLKIEISDAQPIEPLKSLLVAAGAGRGPIVLDLRLEDRAERAELKLRGAFAVSPALAEKIRALPGVLAAEEI